MTVDKNSFTARKNLITSGKKKSREQAIFELLFYGRKKMTVKEVLNVLKPGSDNKGYVAPRLTEMSLDGSLRVCGERLEGGQTVKVYEVAFPVKAEPQTTLF